MMNDDLQKRIGEHLRRRREALELTLEQMSERTGLTPNYIGSIELGKRDLSLSTLVKLTNGYDLPSAELFGTVAELSPPGKEIAELFDTVSPDMQRAILMVLHSLPKKPTRPRKG